MIFPYKGRFPVIPESVFIADNVTVVGDVEIGEDSSLWFGAVVRGDVHYIRIGARTNVQDNSVLHVTNDTWPLNIGSDVTIGHNVTLHGCTVHDRCLIGMGAVVLDGAVVEAGSLVAAGTLIRQGFTVPAGSLVAGVPGKIVRRLSEAELASMGHSAQLYMSYVREYREHGDMERGVNPEEYFAMKRGGLL